MPGFKLNSLGVRPEPLSDLIDAWSATIEGFRADLRPEPCDHYWLVRRGGTCPQCGKFFKPNAHLFIRSR